jgi:hypothetical protein
VSKTTCEICGEAEGEGQSAIVVCRQTDQSMHIKCHRRFHQQLRPGAPREKPTREYSVTTKTQKKLTEEQQPEERKAPRGRCPVCHKLFTKGGPMTQHMKSHE